MKYLTVARKGNWSIVLMSLYIWSGHYTCNAEGWRLFDHQKPSVMRGCFSVIWGCFCWLFSFFVIFFIAYNFRKLLFIIEKGQLNCFILFIDYWRGGGVPIHIYNLFLLLLRGSGGAD
jgi:hypothetical protein